MEVKRDLIPITESRLCVESCRFRICHGGWMMSRKRHTAEQIISKNGSSRIQRVVQNRARVGVLMCSSRLSMQLPFGLTLEVGIPLGLRANHHK